MKNKKNKITGKVDLSKVPKGHLNTPRGGKHKDKRDKRKGTRKQQNDENTKEE